MVGSLGESTSACALGTLRAFCLVLSVYSLVLCLLYSPGAPSVLPAPFLTCLPTSSPQSPLAQSSSLTQGLPGGRGERGEKVSMRRKGSWGEWGCGMGHVIQDLGLLHLGETHSLLPNRVTLEPQG